MEVLLLDDHRNPAEWCISLDQLCKELSSLPPTSSFLSSTHLLMLKSKHHPGFSVSQENLDNFLVAFLTSPTDHPQKIIFSHLTVLANDFAAQPLSSWPLLEGKAQNFTHLKEICFESCQFIFPMVANLMPCLFGQTALVESETQDPVHIQVAGSFVVKVSRKRRLSGSKSDLDDAMIEVVGNMALCT